MDEMSLYSVIGEEGFARLVAAFYKQVPEDDILGPMYPADDLPAAEQSKYWSSLDKGSKQQLLDSMQAVGIQPVKNGK